MSTLTTRLTERAKAFNDARLTHGVADLLTEAATELAHIEQALEREGLGEVLSRSRHPLRWEYAATSNIQDEDYAQADAIRAHLLGDNEGKAL